MANGIPQLQTGGPVLARPLLQANQIIGQQQQNRLLGLQMQQLEQEDVDRQAEGQEQQRRQGLRQDVVSGSQQALMELAAVDPESATELLQFFEQADEQQLRQGEQFNLEIARQLTPLIQSGQINSQQSLDRVLGDLERQGVDVPQRFKTFQPGLDKLIGFSLAKQDEIFEGVLKERNPLSAIGKLRADFQQGFATQGDISRATSQDTQFQSPVGKLGIDLQTAQREFGAQSIQAQAIAEALQSEDQGEPPSLSDTAGLRKEFTKASNNFISVRDAFSRVRTGVETASAAGDVAMVFNFMRMLDPQSVVREGEFAVAASAAGLPDRLVNLARRVDTGERLTPGQRQDFFNVARQVFGQQLQSQLNNERVFGDIATRAGFDTQQVIVDYVQDFRSGVEQATKALSPGTTVTVVRDENGNLVIQQ